MSQQKYSPETVERIRTLASEGLSATQIGAAIGTSRSAICGVAGRNDIKLHSTVKTKPEPEPEPEPVAPLPVLVDEPTSPFAILFDDVRPGQCKRPLWPRAQKTGLVCGKPALRDKTHCADCRRILYLPPVVRTRPAHNDRRH